MHQWQRLYWRERRRAGAAHGVIEAEVARRGSCGLTRERVHDRRVVGLTGEVPGVALVDHHRVCAANHGLAVAPGVPDDADARLEVAAVLVHLIEAIRADADERRCRRIEFDELVIGFCRRWQVVVAHAEVELEVRSERDRILNERANRVHIRVEGLRAQGDGKLTAESLLKRGDARIREPTWILAEAVVLDAPHFAAEFDDLVAAQVGRGVADGECRHLAAARESVRAAEVQTGTGDRDERERDRHLALPHVDAESVRVDERLRDEGDVDAVVAAAHFVDERGAENVRFVDRHDLTAAAAPVGIAGHRLPLRVRLEPGILLDGVVDMQIVALPQVGPRVDGVLIDRDRRQR